MATFTAVEVNPLKGIHVGENVVRSRFTGSLTVSEVLLLAKLPNKAVLTDWAISGGLGGATTGTWKIGFQGTVVDAIRGATLTDDSLYAAASLTAGGNAAGYQTTAARAFLPLKISLSDDAANQFVWIAGTFSSGSQTGTHSINFVMKYLMGE